MKGWSLFPLIRFRLLALIPSGITLALIALLSGCQQKEPEPPKPTAVITLDNLQTAYAKSVKYQNMYSRFVKQAEKEKMKSVADLYRAAARSEEIHAAQHASLMRSRSVEPQAPVIDSITVGTTLQTLKMAVSSEEIEAESMYPNLIHTAELENFSEAVEQFKFVRDADARHNELFQEALNKAGKIPKVPYYICSKCGFIMTSNKTEECPTCHTKKDKFEKV